MDGHAPGVPPVRIVLFSGTTEGRRLSHALAGLGARVTVCVATEYGAEEQGTAPNITVHTGRMEPPAMAELLRGADLCIDATHPYAAAATANIQQAAALAKVACKRLLRPASPLPAGSLIAPDAAGAAALLQNTTGNVLLTTGAKELSAFAGLGAGRLYPRVLPVAASLHACEAAGIPHRNILAMQGPFSAELNLALLHQFDIRYLVTKDGGTQGGFAEKAQAAQAAGVTLMVIRRPADAGETEDEILAYCKGLIP